MTITREACIAAAGQALALGHEQLETQDPHQAALAALRPGGPSVDVLEARIRAQRTQVAQAAS